MCCCGCVYQYAANLQKMNEFNDSSLPSMMFDLDILQTQRRIKVPILIVEPLARVRCELLKFKNMNQQSRS